MTGTVLAPASEAELAALIAEHQPDEVIFAGAIWDPQARLESFARAAEAISSL